MVIGVRASVLALLVVMGAGCRGGGPPSVAACQVRGQRATDDFIRDNRATYRAAMGRALSYLDTFDIDPPQLRQKYGMKGKKKLVELLDALVAIHRYSQGKKKAQMVERFRRAARSTANAGYHNMGTVPDKQFKQDATSYLRAAYLMDKMGMDTQNYRRQIAAVKKRYDAHFYRRGSHQRMVFRHYYQHFGLALSPELTRPFKDSIIAARKNPYLLNLYRTYDVTHEVFVPFDYGGNLSSTFFSAADRDYLRHTLRVLTTVFLSQRNADVVGELLACIRYLQFTDMRVYRDGLSFLLASQRPNGSFGDYERLRDRRGDRLELDLYLHTTRVAMDILPLAFDGPKVAGN